MLDGGVKDGPSSFWSVFANAVAPSAAKISSGRGTGIMLSAGKRSKHQLMELDILMSLEKELASFIVFI